MPQYFASNSLNIICSVKVGELHSVCEGSITQARRYYRKSKNRPWGKTAALGKRKAKSQLVAFMGLNDESDPCFAFFFFFFDLERLVLFR